MRSPAGLRGNSRLSRMRFVIAPQFRRVRWQSHRRRHAIEHGRHPKPGRCASGPCGALISAWRPAGASHLCPQSRENPRAKPSENQPHIGNMHNPRRGRSPLRPARSPIIRKIFCVSGRCGQRPLRNAGHDLCVLIFGFNFRMPQGAINRAPTN
jgi:hypothetical protein